MGSGEVQRPQENKLKKLKLSEQTFYFNLTKNYFLSRSLWPRIITHLWVIWHRPINFICPYFFIMWHYANILYAVTCCMPGHPPPSRASIVSKWLHASPHKIHSPKLAILPVPLVFGAIGEGDPIRLSTASLACPKATVQYWLLGGLLKNFTKIPVLRDRWMELL